jgi:AcrR family transcriptional regulator
VAARKQVSREQLLARARALIEERGLAEFSLRSLAEDLGITSPSLQWHVGSREQLLVDVVDAFMAEAVLPPRELEPVAWLTDAAVDLRDHLRKHERLIPLVRELCFLAPSIVTIENDVAEALIRLGLDGAGLQRAHIAYLSLVLGFTFIEAARDEAAERATPAMRDAMDLAQQEGLASRPALRAALTNTRGRPLEDRSGDELFADALEALLRGLRT